MGDLSGTVYEIATRMAATRARRISRTGVMLDDAARHAEKTYSTALKEHGKDAEIVARIQRLRDQLAEARQELEPEKVYA